MRQQNTLRQLTESIRNHDLFDAREQCEESISNEPERSDFLTILKYLLFWIDVEDDVHATEDSFEAALKYVHSWKSFERYAETLSPSVSFAYYAIQYHAYTSAIALFQSIYDRSTTNHKPMLLHIGRAYRRIGLFEEAVKHYLLFIRSTDHTNAAVYAELADVYALCGEIVKAKVFFLEAFMQNPQEIDLQLLESDLIIKLIKKVAAIEQDSQLIKEWLPVYGVIWGVFNINRELRQLEVIQSKQAIVQLEQEYQEHPTERKFILPRLLSHYLRLIEHFKSINCDPTQSKELLLKIQSICPEIYNQYMR